MRSAAASDAVVVNVSSVEKLSGNATVTNSVLVRRQENDKTESKNKNDTSVRRNGVSSVSLVERRGKVGHFAGERI